MNEALVQVIDYILNRATEKDMVAIKAALERRENARLTPSGKSLSGMVSGMTESIRQQMKAPLGQIRASVTDMVIRMIKEKVPDISEQQLEAMLAELMPESSRQKKAPRALPPEVLHTMIRQFVRYSIGSMLPSEEEKLRQEMGDWPKKYWESFPDPIRQSLSLFLKAEIDEEEFWQRALSQLGME